jgi:UDP-N-acetylglucosamine diphosphorylase/glucosamine-1-phosphate N-acetyltransferase
MNSKLAVVIMAGGLGKRMNSELPKVLHCIKNKPMLVWVIEQALLLQPFKILVIVGKYKDIIIDTLNNYIDTTNIQFVYQAEPLGTGHAIQCCVSELLNIEHSNTLILSGDVPLLQFDTLKKFLDLELDDCKAKLMTTILTNPTGYGRIIENTDNVFTKIVEENDCSYEEKLVKKVNCGIYAFNTQLLCKYIVQLTNNNAQGEYYLTDIIELIKNNELIVINTFDIPLNKQYEIMGVNTIEQLNELSTFI